MYSQLCMLMSLCLFPGLRPRRTLRAVLWTAEEQGGVGAQQYFDLHKVLSTVTALKQIDPASKQQGGSGHTVKV